MKRLPLYKDRIVLNLLAKDPKNAQEVYEATEGHVLIGLMLKQFASATEAAPVAKAFLEVLPVISVGLGAGDPHQWSKVVEAALLTNPGHINQVFSAAAYTVGALKAQGLHHDNVVNALVSPSGQPGQVIISTGPLSQNLPPVQVSCEAAATLLAEVGVDSVKFYPVGGDQRLEEVAAMAKAAAAAGIPIFEPTGGLTVKNVARVVETCLQAGAQVVIPHIYTAIVDPDTGLTKPEEAAALLAEVRKVLDA